MDIRVTQAVYRARDASTGVILAERLRVAHTHWTRLKGLLGTRSLEPGEGLWIKPCRQVHMIGMRYALDIVFLDRTDRVVRAIEGLAPGKISPKVAGATSVLELPAGTLARVGLTEGVQIEIDGDGSNDASWVDTIAALACNVALAALYAVFAAAHVAAARQSGRWATAMPMVAQETLLVALFLARRRSTATSARPLDWLVGIVGTFLPMLLRPTDDVGRLNWIGQPVQIIGLVLALTSLAFLGRSVAVVAANRGIKTAGMYGLVRHPTYAAYIVTYLGYLASFPSLRNGLIVLGTITALNMRAMVEERFLRQDSAYEAYCRRVPWRFVPYVY